MTGSATGNRHGPALVVTLVALVVAFTTAIEVASWQADASAATQRKRTTTPTKKRPSPTTTLRTVTTSPPSTVAVSVPHEEATDLTWAESDVVAVSLADTQSTATTGVTVEANRVTIRQAGTYRVKGFLTDGQLVIDAPDATIRLLFHGVSIASTLGAAFDVVSADKVILITNKESRNSLSDSARTLAPDEADAALFSRADLTLAGEGLLVVTGRAADAIVSKDGLLLAGGTILATGVDDALRAQDYLIVRGGTVTATALTGDALKATGGDDPTRGDVTIAGGALRLEAGADGIDATNNVNIAAGNLTITAVDDGVHAEAKLLVSGGSITITRSREGLEGKIIELSGGTGLVTASDDGINVADGTGGRLTGGRNRGQVDDSRYFAMSGGRFDVIGGADGLDVNGNATITGGQLFANGPSSRGSGAIDADGSLTVTGGLVIAVGTARFDSGATNKQPSVEFDLSEVQTTGTTIQIRDARGKVMGTYRAQVDFDSVAISAPTLTVGATYTLHVGGQPTGTSFGGYFPNSSITTSKASVTATAA